jgi:hypothetical protein
MSIELERRVRQLELRLDELQRQIAAAPQPGEELTAIGTEPPAKPRRRDATGRFAR